MLDQLPLCLRRARSGLLTLRAHIGHPGRVQLLLRGPADRHALLVVHLLKVALRLDRRLGACSSRQATRTLGICPWRPWGRTRPPAGSLRPARGALAGSAEGAEALPASSSGSDQQAGCRGLRPPTRACGGDGLPPLPVLHIARSKHACTRGSQLTRQPSQPAPHAPPVAAHTAAAGHEATRSCLPVRMRLQLPAAAAHLGRWWRCHPAQSQCTHDCPDPAGPPRRRWPARGLAQEQRSAH